MINRPSSKRISANAARIERARREASVSTGFRRELAEAIAAVKGKS